jgi:hypothetical protein
MSAPPPPRTRNATPTARAPRLEADDLVAPPPSSSTGRVVLLGLILLALGGVLGLLAVIFAT